ncbi:MAG: 30S ribosomal protein S20 [Luteolibacter sp.]
MANTKSAIKRNRQTATRTERNRAEKSRMKSSRKKAISAIESGNKDEAVKAASEFASVVDKAAKRNLIHPNKAANLKSKTAKAVAAIS